MLALATQKRTHSQALEDFSSSRNNLLLNDSNQNDHKSDSKALVSREYNSNSKNKSEIVSTRSHSNSNNALVNHKTKPSQSQNEIEITKLQEKSDKVNKQNLEIFVQKNPKRIQKENLMRTIAKEKKLLKNKHIYKAQNLYNNTNMEGLFYEKDTDVSRALKYEKKINKN